MQGRRLPGGAVAAFDVAAAALLPDRKHRSGLDGGRTRLILLVQDGFSEPTSGGNSRV